MKSTLAMVLVLVGTIVAAVLYGRHVQRTADQLQAALDSAVTADSARQVAASAHDSIQRDSIAQLKAGVRAKQAEAATARRRGDSAASVLRATLSEAQQAQLDSLLAAHFDEVARMAEALALQRLATADAEALALFWRLQNDTTQAKLTDQRIAFAKAAKRPTRCGLVAAAGVGGGYPGVGAGGFIGLGCRL